MHVSAEKVMTKPDTLSVNKNIPARALWGRKVLVVGLGLTGRSVARFLLSCGAKVTATDSRPEEELGGIKALREMGLGINAGGFRREDFLNAGLIVISPGIPAGTPILEEARARGIEVIGGLELAGRFISMPIIAVAGTNGKSTVTSLAGEVLAQAGKEVFVGGNIGTPAVEYFLSEAPAEMCIFEVSSFQLESIVSFRPHIAVLLNITDDHLDRYSGFDEYAAVKFRIFDNQREGDYAIVNAADGVIKKEMLSGGPSHGAARVIPFNCKKGAATGLYQDGDKIVFAFEGRLETYPIEAIGVKGAHNIENAMAAIAALRLSGVSPVDIIKGLGAFKGLRHRMEFVREKDGVSYINDSKGTNPGALLMALRSLSAPVVLIAGGRDKLGDYGILDAEAAKKVKLLIAIGEAGPRLAGHFSNIVNVKTASSMEEAVSLAEDEARPGDTVLLSPACSSFDMFSGFKERGEVFEALVRAL